ncbi:universal stress protein [Vampirovibrio chlorellavorus]|uniref:universal stress protein n=1 Tax=Vampirovibrio chlorellavorus TaxID=758823 RepID=UPI0026F0DBCE|nr:universal stress protein [Vampirovibrio chlorellavorus]
MSQIQPNRAQTEERHTESASSTARITRVTLVIEYGDDPDAVLPLIQSLACLLGPQSVVLTLVHAEYDWVSVHSDFADEAQEMGARLAQREIALKAANQAVRSELCKQGFTLSDEWEMTTAGEGSKTLLAQLKETGQDLLILVQPPSGGAAGKASHFGLTMAIHTEVSVLVLRKVITAKPAQLKIWLGVDASDASLNLARKLGQYLGVVDEVPVSLITVQTPVYQENALLAPFVNQSVLDDALLSNANLVFEMCQDILETQGVAVADCRRLLGSPASELGAVAEAEDPDVIAVGSHNRKGVLAWLLGSVSSQLLHWDTHNLLIVR